MHIEEIQSALREEHLDGWLFFDHHQRDPLAYRILKLNPKAVATRRWYYFIPATRRAEGSGPRHRIRLFSPDCPATSASIPVGPLR